jgi:hypothetical protein
MSCYVSILHCEINPRSRRQRRGEYDNIKQALVHEKESGSSSEKEGKIFWLIESPRRKLVRG